MLGLGIVADRGNLGVGEDDGARRQRGERDQVVRHGIFQEGALSAANLIRSSEWISTAALARDGAGVLLIDADPQGSALEWSALRQSTPAFPVIGLPKPVLHLEGPTLAAGYDHVLIDGPPQVADITRSAIMASDVVIVPVQPSPFDVWGVRAVVELLAEAAIVKPTLKAAFAVMRKIVNTAIGRDVTDALAVYRTHILTASLAQRVAFAESIANGMTVLDLDPTGAAGIEVTELALEILEFAHGKEGSLDPNPSDRDPR